MKFMLSDNEYILVVPDPIGECCDTCCAQSKVYFINEDLNINILFGYTESTTFYGGFGFNNFESLLNNELFFDTEKRKSPGFESCQYFDGNIEDTDVIPTYYFMCNNGLGVDPRYNSWFYNDKDGNIIFEFSPSYPFYKCKNLTIYYDKKAKGFIPYETWIKDYKVVIRRVIPKETLIQWNEQAKTYTHVFQYCDYDERQKEI